MIFRHPGYRPHPFVAASMHRSPALVPVFWVPCLSCGMCALGGLHPQDPMLTLCAAFHEQLHPHVLPAMRAGFQSLLDICMGTLRIGTACSGTDVALHSIQTCVGYWKDMFGLDAVVMHEFACEAVSDKRDFIATHWSPRHIFLDICELCHRSAMTSSGHEAAIPHVDVFLCGFECDSISSLNSQAPNATPVRQSTHVTTSSDRRGM